MEVSVPNGELFYLTRNRLDYYCESDLRRVSVPNGDYFLTGNKAKLRLLGV